jgi:hypothetical protein
MSTLTIHSSKKNLALAAVIALAFVFIGVWMLATGTGEFPTAVVINEAGLLDNVSGVNADFVK